MNKAQHINQWARMAVSCLFVLVCSSMYMSCVKKPVKAAGDYVAFANDDITITTERGEILFIPFGALLSEGGIPYQGKVLIHLDRYQLLADTLNRHSVSGKYVHPVQLSSSVINCTDNDGKTLFLNAAQGYGLLLMVPILPSQTARFKDSLIVHPGQVISSKGFDSFGLRVNLQGLPPSPAMNDLYVWSRSVMKSVDPTKRFHASLAYNKIKSAAILNHYLRNEWQKATGNFIRFCTREKLADLSNRQLDNADSVSYMGFNILELYNNKGKTHLTDIFTKFQDQLQNSLLIIDWTGSMHCYREEIDSLAESLVFKNIVRHLALYNDNPDPGFADLKSRQGIFFIDSVRSAEQIKRLMKECANDFCGGENLEEADFSALIRATSQKVPAWSSRYKQVIMLVDNNAQPKDAFLINEINTGTPVYVIAYGAGNVNEVKSQYHCLVKKCGGLLIAESGRAVSLADTLSYHDCRQQVSEKCITVK